MTILPVTLKYKFDTAYVYVFKTKGDARDSWVERYLRINLLRHAVKKTLEGLTEFKDYDYTVRVGFEGYAFGLRGSMVQTMAEIRQGLLDVLVPMLSSAILHLHLLPIPTWKSCLCPGLRKSGMKSKEAIQACLHKYWRPTYEFGNDHNKYDSFGIATVLYWAFFRPEISNPSLERFRDREGIRR